VGEGTGGGLIFTTQDGGESWSQDYWWEGALNDVYFTDNASGWIVGGYEDDISIILHSSDGGQTWTGQESGTDNGLNSVFFTSQETGWIAGNNGTILYTSNGGHNWEACPCPVEGSLYKVCFPNEQSGWAAGEGALLKYDGTWVSVNDRVQPQSFHQLNISHNPFNSNTLIEYYLNEFCHVQINLYNQNGQKLKAFNEGKKFEGYHEIEFDGSELPPGIYFIRLQAGEQVVVKKAVKI
jgi:hypothetical protein